jgi:diaminohydroxyphosphoribosylaminopyrimidine deaminase/5-amino-6-(5-phosphoribosylamino)uracil reductase
VIYAVKDTTLSSEGDIILEKAGIEVEYQYSEEAFATSYLLQHKSLY